MRHMVAKRRASLRVEEEVSSSEKSRFRQPICQFCERERERWGSEWEKGGGVEERRKEI